MKLNKKLFVSSLAMIVASSSNAIAAGYSTAMTSTSGLANSYAGSVTGVHDVSDMFFNPAVLTDVENGQFIASLSYLNSNINAKNGSDGNGGSQKGNVHDAGVNAFVPALYAAKRVNDDTVLGLAITSPFGLATRYNDGWQGSDRALASSITTVNINPTVAYKVNDKISLGGGLQAQYYEAKITYNAASNYYTKVHGSGWGYGFNLGAKYQATKDLKFGIGYRSKVGHNLSGGAYSQGLVYSDAGSKTATPESLTLGTAYQVNSDVELAYDMTWTRWSRLRSFDVTLYQNQAYNSSSAYNWHDSFLHSLGANFKTSDKFLLRTGLAYEKEAMTDAYRNATVPLSNKVWASVGFNYKINPTLSIDAAYVHQFYRTAKSNLNPDLATGTSGLSTKYQTRVDVFSLAVKKEF